jgi:hypothetical protein
MQRVKPTYIVLAKCLDFIKTSSGQYLLYAGTFSVCVDYGIPVLFTKIKAKIIPVFNNFNSKLMYF